VHSRGPEPPGQRAAKSPRTAHGRPSAGANTRCAHPLRHRALGPPGAPRATLPTDIDPKHASRAPVAPGNERAPGSERAPRNEGAPRSEEGAARFRERRVAQIVRDFMDAYVLSAEIGVRLQSGTLDFETVERLVGDSEESALYRLKEECHALFRFDKTSSQEELLAEELFDLAVGALFHEAMKFREGYYLTTTYRTHLERMMESGAATGPLAETFLRVFEAGQQRMMESASESVELFAETREQLLIMLQQMAQSTAVARILVSEPARSREVFGVDLEPLLAQVFGSEVRGYQLAARGLLKSGHFAAALDVLACVPADDPLREIVEPLARGLERLYADDGSAALDALEEWLDHDHDDHGDPQWIASAISALELLTQSDDTRWIKRAEALLARLSARSAPADAPARSTVPLPPRSRRAP
jgi:hypothetical protein